MSSELTHDELQAVGDLYHAVIEEFVHRMRTSDRTFHGQISVELNVQNGRITHSSVSSRQTKLHTKVDNRPSSGKNRP